ncbi:hypothetical protein DQ237_13205 [Blastococcus sp. TF02-8]|uniref:hypothetical protein n=1 Tax=Blastococcus sp. TF02-8 TaxID=2250574 RepID=UPI000DEB4EA5|nr:hypothetical protein [Blastococcus sp. TF02-8]RBY95493.1 hypothetical protein DQ237_13205 [Blastococcus sp. TF02-8]
MTMAARDAHKGTLDWDSSSGSAHAHVRKSDMSKRLSHFDSSSRLKPRQVRISVQWLIPMITAGPTADASHGAASR